MDDYPGAEVYGLIGYPVKHSFSAFMHNAAFRHYKMNAAYELFEVPPEGLEEFFKKTVPEKHVRGFNVTVPYKEKTVLYLTGQISAEVRMNKAVNTVCVASDGTLSGFNTDGSGFIRDLKCQGIDILNKNIALIGAGGAAKAVATGIASLKPREILVFDIDKNRTVRLEKIVNEFYPGINIKTVGSMKELNIMEMNVLINATPVGMKESDPSLVEKDWLRPELFVYDLIYNPGKTKLLKTAAQAGCRCSNGLGMLLHQGCIAFEHWTGKAAPVEVMRKALMERIYV